MKQTATRRRQAIDSKQQTADVRQQATFLSEPRFQVGISPDSSRAMSWRGV
jgi:hypothetical protein